MTVIEVAIGPGGAPGMFTAAPGARSCHAHANGDRPGADALNINP